MTTLECLKWERIYNAGKNKKSCELDWKEKTIKDHAGPFGDFVESYSTSNGEAIHQHVKEESNI